MNLTILSLGAGIQSTTLFLMSCRGELPKLDAAIFADTQWEPPAVYENLEWLKEQGEAAGIPVHTVTKGSVRDSALRQAEGVEASKFATMPLYVKNLDGEQAMLRRQCTREYKVEVIDRFIKRELLGVEKGCRVKDAHVNQWMGISTDEVQRARMSRDYWRTFVYPLLGLPESMLPRPMSRSSCIQWLQSSYPGRIFPRSACIGCPFKSNSEWRAIKKDPAAWKDACEIDEAVRHPERLDGEAYLHRQLVPLRVANIDEDQEMLWDDACDSGYCGV